MKDIGCRVVARTRNVTPNSNGKTSRVWAGSWRGDTEDGSYFGIFFLFFFFNDRMLTDSRVWEFEILRRDTRRSKFRHPPIRKM